MILSLKIVFSKQYRHPELDLKLRKTRTRREAKVLQKISGIIPSCAYVDHSDVDMSIKMKFIDGPMVKEVFETDFEKLSTEIGKNVALLHNEGIIHGDLTTSNMIVSNEIHFIDFGLSFFSEKVEDKAVDLHLLKQALESKHHTVFEKAFAVVLKSYSEVGTNGQEVLERLEIVEKRGRHKQQY